MTVTPEIVRRADFSTWQNLRRMWDDKMAKGEDKNEIIAQEWTSLRSLWDGCKSNVTEETRQEIEKLFPASPDWSSGPESWYALNLAGQRVGACLGPIQLAVEYQNLLDIASARKMVVLSSYQERARLFSLPTPEGVTLDQQRAVYLSLLQVLQSDFIEGRFRRRIRGQSAVRVFYFGAIVTALALLPLVIYLVQFSRLQSAVQLAADGVAKGHLLFSSEPGFGLAMVATFGMLGAYFSRLMSFQQKLAELSFEDVINLYQWRMLMLRVLYGMIGAIIFYYILRAGLLGGTAFPDLSRISIGEQLVWKAGTNGIAPTNGGDKFEPSGLMILVPTAELSKLLVWSFIAGFSERLLPDTLERTEAQSVKAEK